jgi:hypothetical protein
VALGFPFCVDKSNQFIITEATRDLRGFLESLFRLEIATQPTQQASASDLTADRGRHDRHSRPVQLQGYAKLPGSLVAHSQREPTPLVAWSAAQHGSKCQGCVCVSFLSQEPMSETVELFDRLDGAWWDWSKL